PGGGRDKGGVRQSVVKFGQHHRIRRVDLVDDQQLTRVFSLLLHHHVVHDGAYGLDLAQGKRVRAVHHVHQQLGVHHLLQGGAERLHELGAQVPDRTVAGRGGRDARLSWVGRSRERPTVSVNTAGRPSGSSARLVVGSRVANKAFCTRTPAPVIRLRRLDLPALVYPAIAIDGTGVARRRCRLVSRACFIPLISRRNLAIRSRMRRRSVSIFVSPGPRRPTPPLLPARPPACRDKDSPQPRSRGSMYSICANDTCALPSRLVA